MSESVYLDIREELTVKSFWSQKNLRTKIAFAFGATWTLYMLLYLFKIFFYFDIVIYSIAHRAICAGGITIMAFMLCPHNKLFLDRVPWFDYAAIASVFFSCAYVIIYSPKFVYQWGDANALEMVLGIALILALIEATRRTAGLAIAILSIVAFFYIVYSDYAPGFLMSGGFSYPRTVGWIYLSGEGLWGMIIGVVSTTVAAFIIFGAVLSATGASRFFNDLAFALVGSLRGGPAKAAVVSSTFFGTISGSIAANVATTGQITIPLMKANGYKPNMAGAIEAVASTGGMFTPPVMGATAFLMAEFLCTSYWNVCLAAAVPALVYYLILFVQVDLEAAKAGARGLPKAELPSLKKTLASGWQYIVPFIVLIIMIGILQYSTGTSILYTLVSLVLVSFFNKKSRMTPVKFLIALEESAKGMIAIAPISTVTGIIVGALTITGAGANLSIALGDLAGGSTVALLAMAAMASFILGMGMTAVTCYILTVVLIAPALIQGGVTPIGAHMFLFYFGCLSFITPPVAIAAYIAAGISGGDAWKTGLNAMRLGVAAFIVPWGFVFLPPLLFIGSAFEIVRALFFICVGGFSIAIALARFFIIRLSLWKRFVFGVLGLGMLTPYWQFKLYCLIGLTGLYFFHVRSAKNEKMRTFPGRAGLNAADN